MTATQKAASKKRAANDSGSSGPKNADQKRNELKNKVSAAQQRNEQRSFGDYARGARDGATSFVKEHPITTVVGGVALGVLVASFVPGPGRRLRKQATARGAVLAGVLSELALTYGNQLLEGAGNAARAGQDRLGDLGETIGSGVRNIRGESREAAGDAASLTREVGERAVRTLRDLRARMAH